MDVEDGIFCWDRRTGQEESELVLGDAMVRWLYGTPPGRLAVDGLLNRRWVSHLVGAYQSSCLSRRNIPAFIRVRIEYRPIGVLRSPFEDVEGMPVQPSRAKGVRGTVEIYPEFAEGLNDLDGFSHVILLCHLHRAKPHRLRVVPFLDTEPRGLFATRAPSRPNPIGLSVVRLLGIEGNKLSVEGVDMLDGTPVLDIKPYVGEFDEPVEVRIGWLEAARQREAVADDRFKR